MRIRTLVMSVLVGSSTLALLAGCSGKPENSPAIRKTIAEVEENTKTIERLNSDVALLNDQIRRLSDENSELRAFLPDVDGQAAVSKLTALETRLQKLETTTGNSVVSSITAPAVADTKTDAPVADTTKAAEKVDLEKAPLAAKPKAVVAAQQQVATAPAPRANSFKDLTKPKAAAPKAAPKAATKPEAKKDAAAASARGNYHTIEATETVDQIATKYGVSADVILKANRIPAGAHLARGQKLYIPAK